VDEFADLMVTALLLGAGFGVGWILGMVIRRIRGVDDPDREQKRNSKEQRREDKRNHRGLPRAWPKGRFPPRVPGRQPTRPQERQQPPHQNIYLFFGPQDGVTDSESPERQEGGPGRGNRPGPFRPEDIFPGGGRGG